MAVINPHAHTQHRHTYGQGGHIKSSHILKYSTIRSVGACTVANSGVHSSYHTDRHTRKKIPCASCPTPNLLWLVWIRVRLHHQKLNHVDVAFKGGAPNGSTLFLYGRHHPAIINPHVHTHKQSDRRSGWLDKITWCN